MCLFIFRLFLHRMTKKKKFQKMLTNTHCMRRWKNLKQVVYESGRAKGENMSLTNGGEIINGCMRKGSVNFIDALANSYS